MVTENTAPHADAAPTKAVEVEPTTTESTPAPEQTFTQEQVNQFADATLDHQFIHVDPERAAQTPFRRVCARRRGSACTLAPA